jgi:cytoskeleton protein RodZ
MRDENDKVEETIRDEESDGPVGGERLAEARRILKTSVLEIAKELHLDDFKVRALESNDFDVLGAPVFAKGHLKKYAQLVGVDEADVIADYYRLTRSSVAPPVVPRHSRPRQKSYFGLWVAAIFAIVCVAAGSWWVASREVSPVQPVTGEIAPLPQTINPAASEVDEAELLDESEASEPEAGPEPEPVSLPVVESDEPEMTMSVTYLGDCWTEITDAGGRRLHFALGKAGDTVNLVGAAPFNVLFGDAENVSLVVDGASFDIPARDRRGLTARLTIAGS